MHGRIFGMNNYHDILKLAQETAAADPEKLVELYTIPDERCIWASPSHKPLMGYDPADVIGVHWKDLVVPDDHAHKSIMKDDALLTGGSMEIGFKVYAKTGEIRYVKAIDKLYTDLETGAQYVLAQSTYIETLPGATEPAAASDQAS